MCALKCVTLSYFKTCFKSSSIKAKRYILSKYIPSLQILIVCAIREEPFRAVWIHEFNMWYICHLFHFLSIVLNPTIIRNKPLTPSKLDRLIFELIRSTKFDICAFTWTPHSPSPPNFRPVCPETVQTLELWTHPNHTKKIRTKKQEFAKPQHYSI